MQIIPVDSDFVGSQDFILSLNLQACSLPTSSDACSRTPVVTYHEDGGMFVGNVCFPEGCFIIPWCCECHTSYISIHYIISPTNRQLSYTCLLNIYVWMTSHKGTVRSPPPPPPHLGYFTEAVETSCASNMVHPVVGSDLSGTLLLCVVCREMSVRIWTLAEK